MTATANHANVVGLPAGTYTLRVRARNGVGSGPLSSASNRVTAWGGQNAQRRGYWMLSANGTAYGFGDAAALGKRGRSRGRDRGAS